MASGWDQACDKLEGWLDLFEDVAAGEGELSPADAEAMANFFRARLRARTALLEQDAERLEKARREKAEAELRSLLWLPSRRDTQAEAAYWALFHAGVRALDELVRLSEAEVLAVHGIGPKRLAEIKAALDRRGLRLRDEARCVAVTAAGRCSEGTLPRDLFCAQHAA
jgi:DNA-directed RNA polymerase alpha subunit